MKLFRYPGRTPRAFTILEILIALGIFMLILTAVYSTWIAILKGARTGQQAAVEIQRSRIAMKTLEDAFTSTEYFVANWKYYLFFADTSGDMASVSLAARLPDSFLGVATSDQKVRRVSFYTQPGRDGMAELMMSLAPVLVNTNDNLDAFTVSLARDVTMFQMAFYDPREDEWLDEWKQTNQLPKLVKIALAIGKDRNGKAYDVATTLVALPSVGVAPDVQGATFAPPPASGTGVPGDPGSVLPGTYPPGTIPPGTFPGGAYPGGAYPGGAYPGGAYPGGGYPGGAYPPGGSRLPGALTPGINNIRRPGIQ